MNPSHDTGVLIVGGGPTGMATGLELRSRGVDFTLVEAGDGSVTHPKVSAIGPRSMEFFRRWGMADRVRGAGWPGDHTLDCVWVTRVGGHELYRLPRRTMDTRAPFRHTPEPDAICPQHWLGPLLREELGVHPGGPVRMRTRMTGFTQDADGVTARLTDEATGRTTTLRARYLIACDGTSSQVRKDAGIEAPARHRTRVCRNILFRAPRLREELGERNANFFYLLMSSALRFPLRALDGKDLYRLTVGLLGHPDSLVDAETLVRRAIAHDTPVEVLSDNQWHLVHRVAENFRADRVFLVGDAAHTLSPSGGFGMNTGICGAADLGWKLAAAFDGWAGPGLLDSYTTERRPVALEGLEEANRHLVRAWAREIPGELNDDTPEGERHRRSLGADLAAGPVAKEFDAPEIHLGFSYADSPLVVPDPTVPADAHDDRRPNSRPGSRAPHAWVKPGTSTLDLFGDGFVLMSSTRSARTDGFTRAFADRRVPLTVVHCEVPEVVESLERPFVLVRPDGHVAWRGHELPDDPAAVAARVTGAGTGTGTGTRAGTGTDSGTGASGTGGAP
ncbi:FAD-dependent monooxygenase [Streptomyces uncialis]|uniref:FAD-binding monooxygenase n=1 Tax=Streptomyces uncialis TaxID=1048205 RepID=G3K6K1_9ACTN|nr:FAD-dependent monooxygenase [Streptomyces uncialis]AEO12712.1 flavin monooxygenase [Streptomyces uncialis]MCX4662123.1 FAD-dependent monooxygenase [Streptomyces uncialis]OKH94221.1 FAD-binding monooxygenase [Streptomyces uncialis]